MGLYISDFINLDRTKLSIAGGKGANLGELSNIEGITVPAGFCISSEAYKAVITSTPSFGTLLRELSLLQADDRKKIAHISRDIRHAIESTAIPEDISSEIEFFLHSFGRNDPYAVRSSATAEDLPDASFAGQQDTFLNITGKKEIFRHISKCWASLFTARAITYRIQNNYDHSDVYLAVIVQKMIFPEASGILFTADPITSNRSVMSVDASFGLGEALVSGLVNPDIYQIQNGQIIDKKIATKKITVVPSESGGIKQVQVDGKKQDMQVLTDEQILRLENTGRTIEKHFGSPQDIEWCLNADTFYIVQSRPITTLFPIPETNDGENHVFVSVGHQQMMMDAMKPLGLSFYQLIAGRPMYEAGGRLFVDVAKELSSPATREVLINVLGKSDPLIKEAFQTITERAGFLKLSDASDSNKPSMPNYQPQTDYDAAIVSQLIARSQASLQELKREIQTKSGTELLDFIVGGIQKAKVDPGAVESFNVIMTGMNASAWINEKMYEWLGEKNAADILSQSVSDNITSEMGLELLDVADVIRPYPQVIHYLQQAGDQNLFDGLKDLEGGQETRHAIESYLQKYGMRCAGEIDITTDRWMENPGILIAAILSNIHNLTFGERKRKFDRGLKDALAKEQDLLNRLQHLPDAQAKMREAKQKISLIRNFTGYREYPKYEKISQLFIFKEALLKEAERLVATGVIRKKEDVFFLRFEEFREVVRSHRAEIDLINKRKEEYKSFQQLMPPRVMTSDGEVLKGTYKHDNVPAGALVGLPVSSGVAEGRARVLLNMKDADLRDGDILVTTFTDPGWTALFVSVKALVTEVGGLMTHGAVIAREYGLPAVVGVDNATKTIKDGQQIRVNGTEGFVEVIG